MTAATGSPLDVSVFLDYLKEKYSKLYQLQLESFPLDPDRAIS